MSIISWLTKGQFVWESAQCFWLTHQDFTPKQSSRDSTLLSKKQVGSPHHFWQLSLKNGKNRLANRIHPWRTLNPVNFSGLYSLFDISVALLAVWNQGLMPTLLLSSPCKEQVANLWIEYWNTKQVHSINAGTTLCDFTQTGFPDCDRLGDAEFHHISQKHQKCSVKSIADVWLFQSMTLRWCAPVKYMQSNTSYVNECCQIEYRH